MVALKPLRLKILLNIIKIMENSLKIGENFHEYGYYLSIFTILGVNTEKNVKIFMN